MESRRAAVLAVAAAAALGWGLLGPMPQTLRVTSACTADVPLLVELAFAGTEKVTVRPSETRTIRFWRRAWREGDYRISADRGDGSPPKLLGSYGYVEHMPRAFRATLVCNPDPGIADFSDDGHY